MLERGELGPEQRNGKLGALDEIPAAAHMTLRTDRAVKDIVGDVIALLHRRLRPSHER